MEVGSPDFRHKCIEQMKEYDYQDMDNFYKRYLEGENFNYDMLIKLGYCHFEARNINAYINNPHTKYYGSALGWE